MKLIIFDLDGVLVELRYMHYHTLNMALKLNNLPIISEKDHALIFDGLSTLQKLHKLGIESKLAEKINNDKQQLTIENVKRLTPDERLIEVLKNLKKDNMLACASNSVRDTVKFALLRLGFAEYIDFFFSNQDVIHKKPSPEIYFRCMIKANVGSDDTTIVEDGGYGVEGAKKTGAKVIIVNNPSEVTYELLS